MFALGRHTVTQLLRGLGATDCDWSATYRLFSRERFDEEALGAQMFAETLPHVAASEPYVVTEDGVRIPRSGKHVAGSGWWPAPNTAPFRRGLARAQRFVELAWLTPEEDSYCRAIPLRWLPAPTPKSISSSALPGKEWEAGLQGLTWVRAQLERAERTTEWLVVVLDGNYDTQAYYLLFVLAAYRTWGITAGPRRQGRWYPRAWRWSFSSMWHAYQAALWDYADFHPLYARSLDKWLKRAFG